MKKIIQCINIVFEGLPIVSVLGGIVFLYFSFPVENIEALTKTEGFASTIIAITSVIVGLLITTISVFGTSKSYSMMVLSRNDKLRYKFFIYIFGIVLFSVLIFFTIPFLQNNIKFFIFSLVNLLTFFFSYAYISILMFSINIKYYSKEEEEIEKEKKKLINHLINMEIKLDKINDLLKK